MDRIINFMVLAVTMVVVGAWMALAIVTMTVYETSGRPARRARCDWEFTTRLIVNGDWPDKSHRKLVSGRVVVVITRDVVLTVGTRNGGHRSGQT